MICKCFLPACERPFCFLYSASPKAKFLTFKHMLLLPFLKNVLCSLCSKKCLPTPGSQRFSSVFSFRWFIVLALTFRPAIQFLSIFFVYDKRLGLKLFFPPPSPTASSSPFSTISPHPPPSPASSHGEI